MEKKFEIGVLWMLTSATCLSISIFLLKVNVDSVDYFFLLFLRFFIPLVLIFSFLIFSKNHHFKSEVSLSLQVARAACVAVSQYSIVYYMTKNTVFNATILLNASALFIPILEWLFQGHRPAKSTILGALLAFCGVILILKPDSTLFSPMSGIGLLAALGQAGSQILYGLKAKSDDILSSLLYLFLFSSIIAFIIFLFTNETITIDFHDNKFVYLTLFLMGLATIFNQFFRGLSYKYGRPSTMATFLYFAVFVSAILDWLFFDLVPTTLTIIGSVLIILGGVVKVYLRAHFLKQK